MTTAVYPNGIVPWTNRADRVNTVFAADPNSLAAELIAVESTIGTNPHIEAAPPVGTKPIVYTNLGARVHDVQMGNQIPVCSLQNTGFFVKASNTHAGYINPYAAVYDPFKMFNGTDATIKVTGWYTVHAIQQIAWWSSGYALMNLQLMGAFVADDFWWWGFTENKPGGSWQNRRRWMHIEWEGILTSGSRVSVFTENQTSQSQMNVSPAQLKIRFVRSVPPGSRG